MLKHFEWYVMLVQENPKLCGAIHRKLMYHEKKLPLYIFHKLLFAYF